MSFVEMKNRKILILYHGKICRSLMIHLHKQNDASLFMIVNDVGEKVGG